MEDQDEAPDEDPLQDLLSSLQRKRKELARTAREIAIHARSERQHTTDLTARLSVQREEVERVKACQERQASKLVKRKERLLAQKEALNQQEQALQQREQELQQRERVLHKRDRVLHKREQELQRREQELQRHAAAVHQLEDKVKDHMVLATTINERLQHKMYLAAECTPCGPSTPPQHTTSPALSAALPVPDAPRPPPSPQCQQLQAWGDAHHWPAALQRLPHSVPMQDEPLAPGAMGPAAPPHLPLLLPGCPLSVSQWLWLWEHLLLCPSGAQVPSDPGAQQQQHHHLHQQEQQQQQQAPPMPTVPPLQLGDDGGHPPHPAVAGRAAPQPREQRERLLGDVRGGDEVPGGSGGQSAAPPAPLPPGSQPLLAQGSAPPWTAGPTPSLEAGTQQQRGRPTGAQRAPLPSAGALWGRSHDKGPPPSGALEQPLRAALAAWPGAERWDRACASRRHSHVSPRQPPEKPGLMAPAPPQQPNEGPGGARQVCGAQDSKSLACAPESPAPPAADVLLPSPAVPGAGASWQRLPLAAQAADASVQQERSGQAGGQAAPAPAALLPALPPVHLQRGQGGDKELAPGESASLQQVGQSHPTRQQQGQQQPPPPQQQQPLEQSHPTQQQQQQQQPLEQNHPTWQQQQPPPPLQRQPLEKSHPTQQQQLACARRFAPNMSGAAEAAHKHTLKRSREHEHQDAERGTADQVQRTMQQIQAKRRAKWQGGGEGQPGTRGRAGDAELNLLLSECKRMRQQDEQQQQQQVEHAPCQGPLRQGDDQPGQEPHPQPAHAALDHSRLANNQPFPQHFQQQQQYRQHLQQQQCQQRQQHQGRHGPPQL